MLVRMQTCLGLNSRAIGRVVALLLLFRLINLIVESSCGFLSSVMNDSSHRE